jgi:hypothetical protein
MCQEQVSENAPLWSCELRVGKIHRGRGIVRWSGRVWFTDSLPVVTAVVLMLLLLVKRV